MTENLETQARETAEQIVSIFVDDRLKSAELPEEFWRDGYVLGFLLCIALQMTQGKHGDDLDPLVAADAAFDALGDASGLGIESIKERVGELQDGADQEYLKAMKLADKLVRFIGGSATAALDPVVLEARNTARQMLADGRFDPDTVSEETALRGVLVDNLFTEVVRQKFDLTASI